MQVLKDLQKILLFKYSRQISGTQPIYIFGTEKRRKIYISSADYMTRNTIRRVEVAAPVYNEKIKKRLWNMFEILLRDNVKARIQLPDGAYVYKVNDNPPVDAQRFFFEEAYKKAERKAAAKEKAKARAAAKAKTNSRKKQKNKRKYIIYSKINGTSLRKGVPFAILLIFSGTSEARYRIYKNQVVLLTKY